MQRHRGLFRGPILEVGSADYGTTQDLRSLFPGEAYLGVDMLEGRGVDQVLDLTRPFEEIDAALGRRRFRTVFCLSVLEHCDQPFAMADAITRLLEPGGRAYISVPWVWKFHGYPSDYWRFTHEGVKKLFPGLVFDASLTFATMQSYGEFRPADEHIGREQISGSFQRKRGHRFRGLTADALKLLGAAGPLRWLTRHDYLMAPTMIDMVGEKPVTPSARPGA